MPRARLARARADNLGLRRALSGGVLPVLVGAMTFLAALAGAGAVGAAAIARHWQMAAGGALTAQIPQPDEPAGAESGITRMQRSLLLLRSERDVAAARPLGKDELAAVLRPWFGGENPPAELPLPGVIAITLKAPASG